MNEIVILKEGDRELLCIALKLHIDRMNKLLNHIEDEDVSFLINQCMLMDDLYNRIKEV
jgi:hypothetical protein